MRSVRETVDGVATLITAEDRSALLQEWRESGRRYRPGDRIRAGKLQLRESWQLSERREFAGFCRFATAAIPP